MTAQKSTAKHNYFMVNFKNRLKDNRKISIIITILHILSVPAVLLNGILYSITQQRYDEAYELALAAAGGNHKLVNYDTLPTVIEFNEAYVFIAVLAIGIAMLAGVLIALSNYSYLYKKTQVDMYYSLPMTTTQRFFSNFLAGVTSYIGPFLASSFFSLILCFVGRATVDEWINTSFDAGFGFQTMGQLIFQCYLYGTFVLLMIYTISVMVISCCGNIVEAGTYIFGVQALIPATISVVCLILFGDLYGIASEHYALSAMKPTSPVGAFVSFVEVVEGTYDNANMTIWTVILQHLLPFILFIAIYGAIAFLLYRRRKAEDVSKPFVYKLFYYIVSTAVVFCIVCVFFGDNGFGTSLLPVIIVSGIVFFIMDIIANRGFKKFWVSIIRFAATMVVMVALVGIVNATDAFGMVYYVPKAENIHSVTVENRAGSENYIEYDVHNEVTLYDAENIKAVVDAHSKNIERYRLSGEDGMYGNGSKSVSITYRTKMGQKIVKENLRFSPDELAIIAQIKDSEEYKQNAFKVIEDIYNGIDEYGYINVSASLKSMATDEFSNLTTNEKRALLVAAKADIMNTDKPYSTSGCSGVIILKAENNRSDTFVTCRVPISPDYPETYRLITEYKLISDKDIAYDELIDNSVIQISEFTDYDEYNSMYEIPWGAFQDKSVKKAFKKVIDESTLSEGNIREGYRIIVSGYNGGRNSYYIDKNEYSDLLYEIALKYDESLKYNDGTYAQGTVYYSDPEYQYQYSADFYSLEQGLDIVSNIAMSGFCLTGMECDNESIIDALYKQYNEVFVKYNLKPEEVPATTEIPATAYAY